MIQCETLVKVSDNSGAQIGSCIKVLNGAKFAGIGDVIVVAIKKSSPKMKVKSGDVYKAVVIRVKKNSRRIDGTFIGFGDNAVVLVNDKFELIGTRVFGGTSSSQLRSKGFNRILSLAEEVL